MSKTSYFYQELQEMLAQPGCPICHVGRKVARGRLDALLYDSVTDRQSRAKISETMGFCSAHSRELLTFPGERLGATIIEQAVLKQALRAVQASGGSRRSWRQLLGGGQGGLAAAAGFGCVICQEQADIERQSLESLLESLVGDLETPLRAAGGLCWSHLQAALQQTNDSNVTHSLVALHEAVWSQLIEEMGEFIRKRDHRFSHELISDAETVAVEHAIRALTGTYPAVP